MAIYDDPNWRDGMAVKWKEMISKRRPDLCKAIDTTEFVDHLESLKVFNNRTCQTFRSTSGRYSQVSAMLTALLKRPFEDFVKFCRALESSGQRHIITQFFNLTSETSTPPPPPLPLPHQPSTATQPDARPADAEQTSVDPLRNAWKDMIRNNYPSLVNDIDPDNGLMAEIIGRKIIVEWMQDTFTSKEGRSRRAAAILDHLLLKRPYEDFLQFCEALKTTNQGHVVKKYLTLESRHQSNQTDCRSPSTHTVDLNRTVSEVIDEEMLSRLTDLDWKAVFVETRSRLVDEVEASNEFINSLFALGVFNSMSYEACEEKSEFFRMEFILDYMRRRPDEDFIKFCTALAKTNQRHIIESFLEHKIKSHPLSNSCESSSTRQMEYKERVVNHRVIAQPSEESILNDAKPCNQDICSTEDEEMCLSTSSMICHPQDDNVPLEEPHHHDVVHLVQPTELHCQRDDATMDTSILHGNEDDFGPADILRVNVKPCTEQFYRDYRNDAYVISRPVRGMCVIINNEYVHGMSRRQGTEIDGKLLADVFRGLHFEVHQHCDLTAARIKEVIEKISTVNRLRDHQCFVLFVLSHGETDCIFGSDGNRIALSEILAPLTDAKCPNLVGKPRLVFFQACRGKFHQTQTDGPEPPTYRDFVIGYPTQREYLSFRNTELGSWYINALVQVLMEKSCNTSLSEMLNMVSGKISRWSTESNDGRRLGQSSLYESNLTKSFYFFPGIVR